MGIEYAPGATRLEVIDMFRLAAERKLPVYTHMRSAGRVEPGSAIQSVEEVIGASAISGAPVHIVHINSTCLKDSLECLSLVEGARAHGIDVTTEGYPYIAGMTAINSAVFNPGWREKLGIDYNNLVLPGSGEHLTKERFDELHKSTDAKQDVLILRKHARRSWTHPIPNPLIMIASDGAEWASAQCGYLFAGVGPVRSGKENFDLMEALTEDDADASADAGTIDAKRSQKRTDSGRCRCGHYGLRSATPFR